MKRKLQLMGNLTLVYIKRLNNLIKYNNKFLIVLWVLATKKIVFILILTQILLNLLSCFKLIYLIILKREKKLYPNQNIFDNLIFKMMITYKIKKNMLDIVIFLIFSYLFTFIFGFSLRTLKISVLIYNGVKMKYYIHSYNFVKYFLEEEFYIKENEENLTLIFYNKTFHFSFSRL